MLLPGRKYSQPNSSYRYGFNGKEKNNEISGEGNSYDFGARIYDPRLGRWLSLDPSQAKYPYLSPYNAFDNNPIYFSDPDGKDAIATIQGNTITISAKIYIIGYKATKEKAASMQKDIMGYWGGKDFKYKGKDGKEYNVKFDVQVVSYEDKENAKSSKQALTDGNYNLVRLADETKAEHTSYVAGSEPNAGWYGLWGEDEDAGTYGHETGHLLGFDDLYYYDDDGNIQNFKTVDDNDLMGKKAHEPEAKVTQKDINAIGKHVEAKEKNGKAKIDAGTSNIRDKKSLPKQDVKKKTK